MARAGRPGALFRSTAACARQFGRRPEAWARHDRRYRAAVWDPARTGNALWGDRPAGTTGLDCASSPRRAAPALSHYRRRPTRPPRKADHTTAVQQSRTPPIGDFVNGWLARLLTRLYPRAWRNRYAEEFEQLLRNERGGMRTSANVVCSAVYERVFPTQGGEIGSPQPYFRRDDEAANSISSAGNVTRRTGDRMYRRNVRHCSWRPRHCS